MDKPANQTATSSNPQQQNHTQIIETVPTDKAPPPKEKQTPTSTQPTKTKQLTNWNRNTEQHTHLPLHPSQWNTTCTDDLCFFDWLRSVLFVYDCTLHRTPLCHSANPAPSTTNQPSQKAFKPTQPTPSSTNPQQQNHTQIIETVPTDKAPKHKPTQFQSWEWMMDSKGSRRISKWGVQKTNTYINTVIKILTCIQINETTPTDKTTLPKENPTPSSTQPTKH